MLEKIVPQLISLRNFSYGARRLKSGDSFMVNKTEASVLIALGKAKRAEQVKQEDDTQETDSPKPTQRSKAKKAEQVKQEAAE